MNLQEIVKKIDDVRQSIDTAFETGHLDFDKISNDLADIGDSISESLKAESKKADEAFAKPSISPRPHEIKFEDYI